MVKFNIAQDREKAKEKHKIRTIFDIKEGRNYN